MKNTEKFELSTTYEPRSNGVTNLTRYLREMSEWDRISHDQEIELGKRVQAGDEEAVNELVKANLRLVLKIAKEYQNLGLEYMDLVSEGNLGLIRAAEKFDPEYGCRFSTLCAIWVRQFIRRALANQGRTVRLPVYLVDHIQKMRRAEIELNRRLKRPPMDEELAEATGMTLEKIQLMKRSQKASFSLDEDENEEVRSLHERLADENSPALMSPQLATMILPTLKRQWIYSMRENTTLYGNALWNRYREKSFPWGNRQRLRIDPREDTPDSKNCPQ